MSSEAKDCKSIPCPLPLQFSRPEIISDNSPDPRQQALILAPEDFALGIVQPFAGGDVLGVVEHVVVAAA